CTTRSLGTTKPWPKPTNPWKKTAHCCVAKWGMASTSDWVQLWNSSQIPCQKPARNLKKQCAPPKHVMPNSPHNANPRPTPATKTHIRNRIRMAADNSGLILVDKPAGWTSHDVVSRTRKIAGTRKVGHAGTLDPMATGMLVIGFNKA